MRTTKSILAAAFMLAANGIFAQQQDPSSLLPSDFIVKSGPAKTANKTTGNLSRLVQENHYYRVHPGGNRNYSFSYSYSGDNCWDDVFQDWKYDSWTSTSDPGFRTINTFDNKGRLVMKVYEANKNIHTREYYSYQNNKLSEMRSEYISNGVPGAFKKLIYTYNAAGQVADKTVFDESTGAMLQKETFHYSTDGRLVTKEYSGLDKRLFTYFTREDLVYDNGKKSEHIYYYYNSGVWQVNRRELYQSYVGDKPRIAFTIAPDTTRHENHFDANGDPDTTISYRVKNGVDTPYLKTVTTYNRHHQPLYRMFIDWIPQLGTWDDHDEETEWTYFEFNLGVPEKIDNGTRLKLYPIPANNTLTISVETTQQQPLSIAICHTDGRMVRSWTQPTDGTQYKETTDVSSIPAGTYVIRVATAAGVVSRPFNILR
ncbi:MAG: T9SS type A sorting domain-containing protein [Sphingobacteriales bacterium]|nr:MAG: T9SS type A sorting domain-containing protein [Sphingobacteriales bacterium]